MKKVSLSSLPGQRVSHNTAIRKQVMVASGEIPHLVQFAQAIFIPGQIAAGHHHDDMTEVFFVESGQGKITVDHEVCRLEPGVCLTVRPGEQHEVANDGNEDLVLTYFAIAHST